MRTNKPAQWFRLYAEFAHDPKVQMLSEADQRRYIMVLCLRCSNGDVTLQDSDVAFQLRLNESDWLLTKETLLAKGLLNKDNKPTAWDKRQFASDSSAERVARHRALQKQQLNSDVTLQKRSRDRDRDRDRDKKNKEDVANATPYSQIVKSYHEHLPMCPKVTRISDGRKKAMRARWHTDLHSIEEWDAYFATVAESMFLTGRVNGNRQAFFASFDWLLKESNMLKVQGGNYSNRQPQNNETPAWSGAI